MREHCDATLRPNPTQPNLRPRFLREVRPFSCPLPTLTLPAPKIPKKPPFPPFRYRHLPRFLRRQQEPFPFVLSAFPKHKHTPEPTHTQAHTPTHPHTHAHPSAHDAPAHETPIRFPELPKLFSRIPKSPHDFQLTAINPVFPLNLFASPTDFPFQSVSQ